MVYARNKLWPCFDQYVIVPDNVHIAMPSNYHTFDKNEEDKMSGHCLKVGFFLFFFVHW